MSYVVTFRGHIVAGPFVSYAQAFQAALQKHKENHMFYSFSEFKIEQI